MTIEHEATEMMSTNNNEGRNRSVDRLSSLPSDIFIIMISFLPLRLAITTEILSRRWRDLWTNTTSIDITYHDSDKMREIDTNNFHEVDTTLKEIMMTKITSPFINSFNLEIDGNFDFWAPSMDTLIHEICERNVNQLKVTWPNVSGLTNRYRLPSAVFKTQSLESVELGSTKYGAWQFPDDCETINLPNLKKLNIRFTSEVEWIEKLVTACPSLEELSLNCHEFYKRRNSMKCLNQKLQQLFINFTCMDSLKFVVKAPNLEFLAISAPKNMTFSFEKEPIKLREVKAEFTDAYYLRRFSTGINKLSNFYAAISHVRFLTLNISAVETLPTVFRNVTCLTCNMKQNHSINNLLSVLEMCPVLEELTLKFWGVDDYNEESLSQKPSNVRTLQRTLNRIKFINVEIDNRGTYRSKSFIPLVVDLLRMTRNLEYFDVSVSDCQDMPESELMLNRGNELKLCKVLYRCPMASTCCDVEFDGKFLKMSRKDGPKAWTANGEVICFPHYRKGSLKKISSIAS